MYISPDKLRALRTERGWSQDQLATSCGVSLRTIQRIEKDGKCSADTHNALSSALDVTPNTLLPIVETKQTTTKTPIHDGYLGLSIACLVLISLLVLGNSPLSFFDPFALVATLSLTFALTVMSSGLHATLDVCRATKQLIKPQATIENPYPFIGIIQRLIIHGYSAAVVITFVRLNTQLIPSEIPLSLHIWLNLALPITYSVIINEVIWRPLKAKLTVLAAQNVRNNT